MGLRRKLAGLAGVTLSALAGCTDSEENEQSTSERAELTVNQAESDSGNSTSTSEGENSTPSEPGDSDSGRQEIEIGVREGESPPSESPDSDIIRVSFAGTNLYVQFVEDSETDAVAVVSPYGNQLGLQNLSAGDESIPFNIVGQTHGELFPPGEYRIVGFSTRGDRGNQSFEMTESHAVELSPDINIVDVRSVGSPDRAQVVVENTGTAPYPISEVRVTRWWVTSGRDKWVELEDAPLIVEPSETARIVTETRTTKSVDPNIEYGALQERYCNGDTPRRKVEIRASERIDWQESETIELALSGEAVKIQSGNQATVGCSDISATEGDDS
jgi:hypothetical protein